MIFLATGDTEEPATAYLSGTRVVEFMLFFLRFSMTCFVYLCVCVHFPLYRISFFELLLWHSALCCLQTFPFPDLSFAQGLVFCVILFAFLSLFSWKLY